MLLTPLDGEDERREIARFLVKTDDDRITTVPKFKVIELSAFGVTLSSSHALNRRDIIKVHVKDGPSAEVMVATCKLVNPPVANHDPSYRVFCRFVSHDEGRQILESLHE